MFSHQLFSNDRQIGAPITMYCLNLQALDKFGIDIVELHQWADLVDGFFYALNNNIGASFASNENLSKIAEPYEWVMQALKQFQQQSSSTAVTNVAQRDNRVPLVSVRAEEVAKRCVFAPNNDDALFVVFMPPTQPAQYDRNIDLALRFLPKSPSCLVSTQTADGNIASLGWFHDDVTQSFSEAEIRTITDRAAVMQLLKLLAPKYQSMRQLLADWSYSNGQVQLSNAVEKARSVFAKLNIDSTSLLQQQLKEATATLTKKQEFERLLLNRINCSSSSELARQYDILIENAWWTAHYTAEQEWTSSKDIVVDIEDENLLIGLSALKAYTIAKRKHFYLFLLRQDSVASVMMALNNDDVRKEFLSDISTVLKYDDDDPLPPNWSHWHSLFSSKQFGETKLPDVIVTLFQQQHYQSHYKLSQRLESFVLNTFNYK